MTSRYAQQTISSGSGCRNPNRCRRSDKASRTKKWWFASTAIPLIAATIGPFSNVLSIVSLVSPWRFTLPDNGLPFSDNHGSDDAAWGIPDPNWEIIPNIFSIIFGLLGHLFLLLNFTRRVRYIVALPLSIVFWLLSALILIVVEIAMAIYAPPVAPGEAYSQGFWHSVLASLMYVLSCAMLMVNMVGYFKGHYPQKFELDDDQRTLILQTMSFFFWLAGGAGVFCALEGFTYADSLYFSQVTILTVGFGDFAPKTDSGRGFLFAFQIIGVIFLGLVIGSLTRFAANISADKIIKRHRQHKRESTVGRTVTSEKELRERLGLPPVRPDSAAAEGGLAESASEYARRASIMQLGRLEIVGRAVTFDEGKAQNAVGSGEEVLRDRRKKRRQKLLLLEEEKDRFDVMRQIQEETKHWKQSWALGMALLVFFSFWTIGALVFMVTETRISQWRYFDSLYFCFVAILTIGYGDLAPKSNIGKPFFIVWSITAVPIVTVLVQQMSQTVVMAINRGTFTLADWTIMPKKGILKSFLTRHSTLAKLLNRKQVDTEKGKHPERPMRDERHFSDIDPERSLGQQQDGSRVLEKEKYDDNELAKELSAAIKAVAHDLRSHPPKVYSYGEWERFTKLIRFTALSSLESDESVERDEQTEWDWIGEDSPLLADVTEAEWILDRLCESLGRWMRRQVQKHEQRKYWDEVFDVMEGRVGDRRKGEAATDTRRVGSRSYGHGRNEDWKGVKWEEPTGNMERPLTR
ncbi:Potassium channel [Podospora pseudocomata]|uniref:Potassium channel n=1 Tax=Podospora pseudocomata TaxID=2093779 RepID=A0ABR0GZ02_9PEZI|nr:Potassium channel [Podospora pseudocomata]